MTLVRRSWKRKEKKKSGFHFHESSLALAAWDDNVQFYDRKTAQKNGYLFVLGLASNTINNK